MENNNSKIAVPNGKEIEWVDLWGKFNQVSAENQRLELDLGLAIIAANGFKSRLESANEYIEQLENQRDSERQQHKEQMEQLAQNLREINRPELG